MTVWPEDYSQAWTLGTSVERTGVGLHSGTSCRVRLQPSERPGYSVGWLDAPALEAVALHPSQVSDTRLCTALRLDQRRLATVEHLLAALAGTGLSHVELLVEGEEIPLLDGSALPWVEAIAAAGLRHLGPREPLRPLDAPITLQQGQSFATALPSDTPRIGAAIEFSQPAIGRQVYSLELTPSSFVEQIAPARTFGFRDQIDQLRAAGLIRGGDLESALVCDGDHWLNPPLRFPQEPVRHKLLDLLGDLALAGLPQAQVFAFRGSHGLHTALAAALAAPSRST
ncbi:UDP-3-O-acyl-N-acetylglucosamine deacetylase [Synechococcus sp. BA-124 BA4]|uniref:UDP-3-O-acyl-N-acetylglucosamine deacetylase n=1 Tax=unclassified Synechococcus TaxID=2626047 RepID=UPI0018CFD536|nr:MULTISPECIES: UDP-3-O-acyl-N-acetylglucosamine deacetylase [unclassified Synechococcus]MEA5399509.1 UDP-3-O-acyl-N-acetylglucosamine deacetylase [Synechococcus sp. BA-124 BA4]QPN55965.1 UDP-3-O-acyl-N-acetylglucosamine deacetylase [Synechococcus sp. CBW1107]CAK6700148.1 UDP-3-O-acyl-N-acetylglucosamine deacetylase [Synechococcus sp. CBW1107]